MKRKLNVVSGAIISSLLFCAVACTEDWNAKEADAHHWTQDEVRASLKFVQDLSPSTPPMGRSFSTKGDSLTGGFGTVELGIGFGWYLYTKKSDCKKDFSLCKFHPLKPNTLDYVRSKSNKRATNKRIEDYGESFLYQDDEGYFMLALLEEAPNPQLTDEQLQLNIEEPVMAEDDTRNLYLSPGVIRFDRDLGLYGGYVVRLTAVEEK